VSHTKGFAKGFDWKTFAADGTVDWAAVEAAFPYVAAMAACIQDPVFHAEGSAWIHTKMVMAELLADPQFQALPPQRKTVMGLAVLWHDASKPETREVVFDQEAGRERISHPHHASRGAMKSWRDLWRAGVPLNIRFAVFSLVMAHMQAFHVLQKPNIQHQLARFSINGSWYELTMLAKADNRGRICPDKGQVDDEMALLRLYAEENHCLHQPWRFESDQARLRFGRGVKDSLFFNPPPPTGSRVVVVSGLPGMGKDTYIERHLKGFAHVSLDLARDELDIAPTDNQGHVAQATAEACRVHLRAKAPFVFNATNLTRLQRSKIIDLAIAYDAHVEIHALDVPEKRLRKNNSGRKLPVPDAVIDRMIAKWEPPTPLEAHRVVWIGEDLEPVPDAIQI
jgi:predicted kinase